MHASKVPYHRHIPKRVFCYAILGALCAALAALLAEDAHGGFRAESLDASPGLVALDPGGHFSTGVSPAGDIDPTRDGYVFVAAYRTIDFDRLTSGTIVADQYPGAIFSGRRSSLKVLNLEEEAFLIPGHSSPNMLCPGSADEGAEVMSVDFVAAVDYLTFVVGTKSESSRPRGGVVGSVTVVYAGGSAEVPVMIDGNVGVDLVDLSEFTQITRIVINDFSEDGLLLDDFEFSQIRRYSTAARR